jgi:hypothetical protein
VTVPEERKYMPSAQGNSRAAERSARICAVAFVGAIVGICGYFITRVIEALT